jgi:ferric iron reductase protein FhuF
MTATLERPVTSHPLEATLHKLQASFTWTKLYTKPEGDGWYSYHDVIDPASDVFTLLLEKYQKRAPYLNKRQAVQTLFSSLSWWCATACYGPILIDQRSPTNLEHLYFHFHDEGYIDTMALEFDSFLCLSNDEVANHPKATTVSGQDELVTRALQQLQTTLQPLINIAKIHATIQDKGMWLYVADNFTQLILFLQQSSQQQSEAEVETVLRQLPERGGTGVLEVRHSGECEYHLKRSTCCFYYLNPEGEKCTTCPKVSLEARVEKLQTYMATKVQQERTEVAV